MIGTRARSQAPPAPRPPLRRLPPWWPAAAVAALLWAALALCILAQRLFVSNDSLSTYAHVWWIADSIWDHGRLPFAMPVLNHGNGHAFPYGAPAWTVAALLWRVLGEWSVTLLLVLGAVAAVAAAVRWQPALREPFLLALHDMPGDDRHRHGAGVPTTCSNPTEVGLRRFFVR